MDQPKNDQELLDEYKSLIMELGYWKITSDPDTSIEIYDE